MAQTSKKNLPEQEKIFPIAPESEPNPPEPESEPENAPPTDAEPPKESEHAAKPKGRPKKGDEPPPTIIDTIRGYATWEGRSVYVYRIAPYTDRKVGDNTLTNCAKYERAIDESDLLHDLGSGVYQLRVVYDDPGPNGKREMVAKANVRVLNIQFPPRIPKIEAMWEDSRNKDWLWAKDLIEQKDAASVAKQVVQDSGQAMFSPMLEMMKEQMTAMREELKSVRDSSAAQIAAANAKKDDGSSTIVTLLNSDLAKLLLAKLMTPAPPPPDPMASLTAAIALVKGMMPAPAPVAAAPETETGLGALEKHLEISKKLEELHPAQESRSRSKMEGWQEFGIGIMKELSPIIAPIAQVIAIGVAQKQREAAAAQQQQQTNQPQTQQPRPATNPQGLQVVQPQPTQTNAQPPADAKKPRIEVIAAKVLELLEANEEESGYQLGDWYIEEFGMEEFNEVRVQGKNRILDDIGKVQTTASELSKYFANGELDALITEFLTWEPAPADAVEETAAPPAESSNPWVTPVVEVQQ